LPLARSPGQAAEHGENAVEKVEGLGHIPLLDIAPGKGHADRGAELVGTPEGDPPVVNAVATDPPAGLG